VLTSAADGRRHSLLPFAKTIVSNFFRKVKKKILFADICNIANKNIDRSTHHEKKTQDNSNCVGSIIVNFATAN